MDRFGSIHIKVQEQLEKSGLSKNKLSQRAEMQRTQLNNYINNRIALLDINVLARLCSALQCNIGDILEYIPPQGEEPSRQTEPQ